MDYAIKKWLTPGLIDPDYSTSDDNDFVSLRFAEFRILMVLFRIDSFKYGAGHLTDKVSRI